MYYKERDRGKTARTRDERSNNIVFIIINSIVLFGYDGIFRREKTDHNQPPKDFS